MLASGIPFETVHRRKDGTEFPVEVNSATFQVEGRTYFQKFVRDITYRKRLENEIARLAKVQTALRTAAGVLLRATSQDELYQGMCRILVDIGGYRLASIALANDDAERSVRFVAAAGRDVDYLQASAVTWDAGARSHGPTGEAILTGEVQINQDVASNPAMALWREESLKRGLLASIGLPLRAGGRVIGALTIHAAQAFAFDREEVAFLVQFAADISYGIDKLLRVPPRQ
jgi:GAF domain-containing protein